MFETNVLISVTKKNSKISTHVALFIINMNMCLNFESEWSTFDMQKGCLKLKSSARSKVLSPFRKPKNYRFAWNFNHWNFESNGTYCKTKINNPNYCVPMVIGQNCKNAILRIVHPLGWLIWTWFYPTALVLAKIGPIDLVIYRWLCPSLSQVGTGQGLLDPKSSLFWGLIHIVQHL